jgi:hypothetical protein
VWNLTPFFFLTQRTLGNLLCVVRFNSMEHVVQRFECGWFQSFVRRLFGCAR